MGHDPGSQFSEQRTISRSLSSCCVQHLPKQLESCPLPHPVAMRRRAALMSLDHRMKAKPRCTDLTQISARRGVPVDGGAQIVKEVIAWSRVPAGNTPRGARWYQTSYPGRSRHMAIGRRQGTSVCDAHAPLRKRELIGVWKADLSTSSSSQRTRSKHDGFEARSPVITR